MFRRNSEEFQLRCLYSNKVAVNETCMPPLLSSASEEKTTVGLPTGIKTALNHMFWRISGSEVVLALEEPRLLRGPTTTRAFTRPT